jgi:hypothetical protein
MSSASLFRILALSFCVAHLACGQLGENGIISFQDETRVPGGSFNSSLSKPIAEGSRIRVIVSEPLSAIDSIESTDNQIVKVERRSDIENNSTRVTLTTGEAGDAFVEVKLKDGRNDRVALNVASVQSTEITIYPWDSIIPLSPELWHNGVSLLPNSNLTVFGSMKTASGQTLSGYGAYSWTSDSNGDAIVNSEEISDFAVINSGNTTGDHTLRFGNSSLSVPTILSSQVSEMQLIVPFGTMTVSEGEIQFLHAALFTADGTYVVGIDDEPVIFEASSGLVLNRLLNETDLDEVDRQKLERAYRVGRAADFSAGTQGTYTITARWKDLSTQVTVDVLPTTRPTAASDN